MWNTLFSLTVAKDYWLICACLIESAAFIKDLYLIIMFCSTSGLLLALVPGVARANIKLHGYIVKINDEKSEVLLLGNCAYTL